MPHYVITSSNYSGHPYMSMVGLWHGNSGNYNKIDGSATSLSYTFVRSQLDTYTKTLNWLKGE